MAATALFVGVWNHLSLGNTEFVAGTEGNTLLGNASDRPSDVITAEAKIEEQTAAPTADGGAAPAVSSIAVITMMIKNGESNEMRKWVGKLVLEGNAIQWSEVEESKPTIWARVIEGEVFVPGDLNISCSYCKQPFIFSGEQQLSFLGKGYVHPRKCEKHRGGGRGGRRGDREGGRGGRGGRGGGRDIGNWGIGSGARGGGGGGGGEHVFRPRGGGGVVSEGWAGGKR